MSEEDLKILEDVTKRVESKKTTQENARATLISAGILTRSGNVKNAYKSVFTRK